MANLIQLLVNILIIAFIAGGFFLAGKIYAELDKKFYVINKKTMSILAKCSTRIEAVRLQIRLKDNFNINAIVE